MEHTRGQLKFAVVHGQSLWIVGGFYLIPIKWRPCSCVLLVQRWWLLMCIDIHITENMEHGKSMVGDRKGEASWRDQVILPMGNHQHIMQPQKHMAWEAK